MKVWVSFGERSFNGVFDSLEAAVDGISDPTDEGWRKEDITAGLEKIQDGHYHYGYGCQSFQQIEVNKPIYWKT